MQRVLEPELMTEEEQARAYAEADYNEAHQSYVRLFAERFPQTPWEALALDIGCGPCDVTRRFAEAFPGWRFHGVDGSPAMLGEARRALAARPDLAARITLMEAVLPGVALLAGGYDVVLSTSLLHHLREPQVLWQSIRQWAAPGASIFVADLFRPDSDQIAEAMVARYIPNEPPVQQRDFYNSLRAAFTPDEVWEQLAPSHLDVLPVEIVSDRHLIVWGWV